MAKCFVKQPNTEWHVQPPQGMPSISPVLFYEDLATAAQWLCSAFGFVEKRDDRITDEDGRVQHAEITLGNGLIILSSEYDDFKAPSADSTHHQVLYVFVDDVNAHASQAREQGAVITSEPSDRDYGARVYGAQDVGGYHWIFAEQL